MVYFDAEKGFRELRRMSDEELRGQLVKKADEYSCWLYNKFLPNLARLEEIARKSRIIVTGSLDLRAA